MGNVCRKHHLAMSLAVLTENIVTEFGTALCSETKP